MALVGLLWTLGWGAPLGAGAVEEETEAVQQVFDQYRAALMRGDGNRAAALVDRATFEYFEQLKLLALRADHEELGEQSFVDRLLVVTLRHTLTPDEVREITLSQLIDLAMEAGWLAPETLGQLEMGEVVFDGDQAFAPALSAGGLSLESEGLEPLNYTFVREDGAWKFRFSALVASLGRLVASFTAQLGAQDEALIFMLVENLSGRAVVPQVWEPQQPAQALPSEDQPVAAEPPNGDPPPPALGA
jgi:hypothetical protein